jgi:hypothetical protein
LYEPSTNTLRNNQMTGNLSSFGIYGVSPSHYVNDVDTSNTVNGKPVYNWINQYGKQVPRNAGHVVVGYIMVFIELPRGYNARDISASSIIMNNTRALL